LKNIREKLPKGISVNGYSFLVEPIYYKPFDGKKVSKPSMETPEKDGVIVSNTDVVDKFRDSNCTVDFNCMLPGQNVAE
jgi:hypothetical protein